MKNEKFTVKEYIKAAEICEVSILDTMRVISSLKEARSRLKIRFNISKLNDIAIDRPEIFY